MRGSTRRRTPASPRPRQPSGSTTHVALLKATAAGLAANPQIAKVFDNPEGCTLSFEGLGGPDKGHLDIIRADGTVACTSKEADRRRARRQLREFRLAPCRSEPLHVPRSRP